MTLALKKLTDHIGVEITGVDASRGVDAETAAELRKALDKHFVVLLRNQQITPEQEVEYARIYGQPESTAGYGGTVADASSAGLPPEIFQVTNDPENPASESLKGTVRWHTDLTWSNLPSKGAVLHAQKLPSDGAGTRWCALYAAWEDLPQERKAELEKIRVVHSVLAAQMLDHPDPSEEDMALWRRVPPVEHPLVWTHSDGRKSLVLGATVDHVVGMSKAEGEALIAELETWCTQDKYIFEHHWAPDDLLIWFNSATMHAARKYTGAERRLLYRITITGDEEIN